MKFISLNIKQGLFIDKFDFTDGVNIIYSKKNSVGKTSLLRLLIYSCTAYAELAVFGASI
jgi:hypothetical protein